MTCSRPDSSIPETEAANIDPVGAQSCLCGILVARSASNVRTSADSLLIAEGVPRQNTMLQKSSSIQAFISLRWNIMGNV